MLTLIGCLIFEKTILLKIHFKTTIIQQKTDE